MKLKFLSCLCLVLAAPVLAQPVQVSESEFAQLSAGLPRIVEDFNAFPAGPAASPVALRNGQFSGSPSFGAPWCLSSQCLNINFVASTFGGLPRRTVGWSTRLIPAAGNSNNVYDFDVVGTGGSRRFTLTGVAWSESGAFVGFHDPQGIREVSVSLRSGGLGINYSLDDVTVAIGPAPAQSVPTGGPAGMLVLGFLLLLGAGIAIRRG